MINAFNFHNFIFGSYIGHGSGSQYLPGELVEAIECKSVVLLFGCSSVRLTPQGHQCDPWGVVLNYFIGFWLVKINLIVLNIFLELIL